MRPRPVAINNNASIWGENERRWAGINSRKSDTDVTSCLQAIKGKYRTRGSSMRAWRNSSLLLDRVDYCKSFNSLKQAETLDFFNLRRPGRKAANIRFPLVLHQQRNFHYGGGKEALQQGGVVSEKMQTRRLYSQVLWVDALWTHFQSSLEIGGAVSMSESLINRESAAPNPRVTVITITASGSRRLVESWSFFGVTTAGSETQQRIYPPLGYIFNSLHSRPEFESATPPRSR